MRRSTATAVPLTCGALVAILNAHAPPPWAVWMLLAPGPVDPALEAVMGAFVAAFSQKAK